MEGRPISTTESMATALRTPLPEGDLLEPPRAPYVQNLTPESPRDSYVSTTQMSNNTSGVLLPAVGKNEVNEYPEERRRPSSSKRRTLILLVVGLAVLATVVLVIVLPVYFKVVKPRQRNTQTGSSSSGTSAGSPTPSGSSGGGGPKPTGVAISGGDGSTIVTEDGSSFVYSNKFDGFWVSDPNDPFNNNARPNSWTPPLNQSWTWGKDRIFGVNLGGLFVLEPFISPALYQKYPGAVDEWTLSTLMAADTASGGLGQLEEHYKTFITEQDIAEIAGAGLNWIRLPIPFWAVDKWSNEPFLAQTSWKYILRVLGWCRKYGLRVNLDLHTIPGSQNAYNHSGKGGQVNFLNGVMGMANAQRALEYIRVITEFISQPQYKALVPMFSIMNEPLLTTIGQPVMSSFYLQAHNMIRGITGFGEGNGPFIGIHDGFHTAQWAGFLPGSDRIALDTHPYFAFGDSQDNSPIDTGTGAGAGGTWPQKACNSWGGLVNNSRTGFGVTIAGEFSNAINDCGLFIRGVGGSASFGNCADWDDSTNWSAGTKAGLQQFVLASMDALQDSFFWTWKIGNSTKGIVEAPLWSYQLGLHNGWMPKDPRKSIGFCASIGEAGPTFDGNFQPWQTGGAGAGTIAPSATAEFPWPPPAVSNADVPVSSLPSYTATGVITSLPPPTFTASATKSVDAGNGWFNAQDTAGAPTTIAGCSYPDPWNAVNVAVPPLCGGGAAATPTAAIPTVVTDPATVVTAPPTVPTDLPTVATDPAAVTDPTVTQTDRPRR